MKGRIVLSLLGVLTAAALVGVLAFFGVPPLFGTAWVLLAAAIGIITRQSLLDEDHAWPPPKPEPPFRGSEVSRLAWAVNARTGVVSLGFLKRLDGVLRARLALRGLDLDDPAQHADIDALLGPGIRAALQQRAVQRADVERALTAIESIPPGVEQR